MNPTQDHVQDVDRSLVVIMEDEPGIRNALAITLNNSGYRTCELSSLDGLDVASIQNPFLVVLDVSLEQSDAVEVLRALGRSGFTGAVQLISGSSRTLLEQIRLVGERHGIKMLPALRKPFRMREIRAIADAESRSPARRHDSHVALAAQAERHTVQLRDALETGTLEVWYQPKFSISTKRLVGAECLARVRHPTAGVMSPASFLPGAADEDLAALTTFVLHKACSDWPDFKAAGISLRLAVNIPGAQLTSMPLPDMLRKAAPQAQDWPGVIFEITEEEALRDVDAAHEVATQLGIYGAELSIDDFGVGYSSLARLREIPFREVKLDRSLVDGCARDATRAALCRTVVDLAHTLAAIVVAEGIETREDLSYLQAIGCDLAQGFLLGRPMPKAQLVEEIARTVNTGCLQGNRASIQPDVPARDALRLRGAEPRFA